VKAQSCGRSSRNDGKFSSRDATIDFICAAACAFITGAKSKGATLRLGGARIDPRTDGRPDPRPDVRENAPILGNLVKDFDFTQKPRAPLVLKPVPVPAP